MVNHCSVSVVAWLPLRVEFSEMTTRPVNKLADGLVVVLGALAKRNVFQIFHHLPALKGVVRLRIVLPIWCGEAVTPNHALHRTRRLRLRLFHSVIDVCSRPVAGSLSLGRRTLHQKPQAPRTCSACAQAQPVWLPLRLPPSR